MTYPLTKQKLQILDDAELQIHNSIITANLDFKYEKSHIYLYRKL